jgi:hypothetical protein
VPQRFANSLARSSGSAIKASKTPPQAKRRLLTRHVPWLLLRAPDLVKEHARADLERVLAVDELRNADYHLVQRFRRVLHDLHVIALSLAS